MQLQKRQGMFVWLCLLLAAVLGRTAQAQAPIVSWDTFSDTWVVTDGLGRKAPTAVDVGLPRAGKTVGMFYFLTFAHGGSGPYDNTQILKAHPEAMQDVRHPAWGPLNADHYWGEPLFGYYASDDEWVLRKHAHMLANAGVDVVVFDNSNAVTYDKARRTLCKVWEEIRRQGGKTPQIAFLCPFGNSGGIGSRTLAELYDTLYAPGLYADLWFRWNGKPLVLAYPAYATEEAVQVMQRQPAELAPGETLGQVFTISRPFTAVGGSFPTWATAGAGMTLSLFADRPGGKLLARQRFDHVTDNLTLLLETRVALPAGAYYLEMSLPKGHIGWWGRSGAFGNGAFQTRETAPGDRSLVIRYSGEAPTQAFEPAMRQLAPAAALARARKIREFFTFRTPIAPYDTVDPPVGGWAWLQNYPQAVQRSPIGEIEQITVGVAQNYNARTHLAPMSFPGAFGRSYHQGKLETGRDAVRQGYNFAEQWERARQVDPPFVFVTGWNEWTAGFYDDWAGYHAPPPIFVDEFNEEFSRDIEPMRDGHGDDYYYQLAANVRRYKGARSVPPITPAPIRMDGNFSDWKRVTPEFRDSVGDTAHRNAPGSGQSGPYVNTTGRNDIVAAKVSFDALTVYFYVRTRDNLTSPTDPDWMRLYLDTDSDARTGWLGYDFAVNRSVGKHTTSLDRYIGGKKQWEHVGIVPYIVRGKEMEIAIPRAMLGSRPIGATLDFKWADHCFQRGDWTDFTLNGDAAPDDRFNYHAIIRRGGK
jgi:hypothetical protein